MPLAALAFPVGQPPAEHADGTVQVGDVRPIRRRQQLVPVGQSPQVGRQRQALARPSVLRRLAPPRRELLRGRPDQDPRCLLPLLAPRSATHGRRPRWMTVKDRNRRYPSLPTSRKGVSGASPLSRRSLGGRAQRGQSNAHPVPLSLAKKPARQQKALVVSIMHRTLLPALQKCYFRRKDRVAL